MKISGETKKKVLIIEDEMKLQKLVKASLEDAGFEAISAFDGEDGIEKIEEYTPDLILLDLILPKKDGFEVLEHLKLKKELKNIPVMVLTNLEEKYNIEKALSYDVRAYLVKANYRPEEIVDKVNELLK